MIEIVELQPAPGGRLARLSCTCSNPQLATCRCAHGHIIYCTHCGELTTPDQLRQNLPGGMAADLILEDLPQASTCPMVSVTLPATVRCAACDLESAATITKLSPEKMILRLARTEVPSEARRTHGSWEVICDHAQLSCLLPAKLVQVLTPQSAAGTAYYEFVLDPQATFARQQLVDFYQSQCHTGHCPPSIATDHMRETSEHTPAPEIFAESASEYALMLAQAQRLPTDALTKLCDTAVPLHRTLAQSLSIEVEDFIRVLCMASETHDTNSSNHLKRIAAYSAAVGHHLGWTERRVAMIATASKLHDVGKMGVPDQILKKPDALTLEERRTMQQHTRFGHQILQGSSSEVIRLGALIALRHHERFDGTGYPDGIAGELVPIEAQLVSMVDVFDALTSARAYKPAWSNDQARTYIHEQSGKMFRPDLVTAFEAVWPEIEKNQLRFLDDFRDIWTERRKSNRQQTDPVPLQIEIVVPEQTFRPMRFNAALINLSPTGMKIKVQGVTNDMFSIFVASRRYAKITFPALLTPEMEGSFCTVVWMDYYAVPNPDACLMGLEFQKISQEQQPLYHDLLNTAAALA